MIASVSSHKPEIIHGSCVAVSSRGVLLLGKSGSGKSDLCLRLMASSGLLVADDQVVLRREGHYLIAGVQDRIRGLLEVRGVGIIRYPVASNVPVALVVNLVERDEVERLPTPVLYESQGLTIPMISLHGHDAASADKIHAALYALSRDRLHTGFLSNGSAVD